MHPAFTVPPVPHFLFNSLQRAFNSEGGRARPESIETPLPLRPLVERPIRIIPSLEGVDCCFLHLQLLIGDSHLGHIFP